MGGVGVFAAFCGISHSVRLDVSAHFSALDDEEFFVVEGSRWRGRRESDSQVFCHTNAKQRRERRLRQFLRHERLSVAMALAAAQHHSAPKSAGPETYEALRGQNTAKAGRRPGVLKDPEPQGRAGTDGYVAAPVPLLVVASLAGGDEVDATTVSFLLRKALALKEEEEEKGEEACVGGEGEEGGAREGDAGAQTPCQARRVAQRG